MPIRTKPAITNNDMDSLRSAKGCQVTVHMVFRKNIYQQNTFTGDLVDVVPFRAILLRLGDVMPAKLEFVGDDMAIKLITGGKRVIYENPHLNTAYLIGDVTGLRGLTFGLSTARKLMRKQQV